MFHVKQPVQKRFTRNTLRRSVLCETVRTEMFHVKRPAYETARARKTSRAACSKHTLRVPQTHAAKKRAPPTACATLPRTGSPSRRVASHRATSAPISGQERSARPIDTGSQRHPAHPRVGTGSQRHSAHPRKHGRPARSAPCLPCGGNPPRPVSQPRLPWGTCPAQYAVAYPARPASCLLWGRNSSRRREWTKTRGTVCLWASEGSKRPLPTLKLVGNTRCRVFLSSLGRGGSA